MKLGSFTSWSYNNGKEVYKKMVMYAQSVCFANLKLLLFAVLVAVIVAVA